MSWRAADRRTRRTPGRLPLGSLLFFVWLAGLAGCAASLRGGAPGEARHPVTGKVAWDGAGSGGAEVLLYPLGAFQPPGAPPAAVARAAPDGSFRLEAAPGTYLLLARQGERFAFFGRNPVRLNRPLEGVNLPLVATHPVARAAVAPGEERLEGRILHRGEPVVGARVYLYLKPNRGFRGPGFALSEPTGADGRFAVPVTPGSYFAVARRRAGGGTSGSLEPGDQFGVHPAFPLVVHAGEGVTADLETVVVPTRERMARFHGHPSVLAGQVVDADGNPVAGLRACLYDSPAMINQPLALSEPTGADGRFTLQTDRTGTLYLGARVSLGGPPALGEPLGFYRGPDGSRLELTPQQRLTDLTIVVQRP